jgi:hypothetical protein
MKKKQAWEAIPTNEFKPQPGMAYIVLYEWHEGTVPFMAQYMAAGHWESIPSRNVYTLDSISHVVVPKGKMYANLTQKLIRQQGYDGKTS